MLAKLINVSKEYQVGDQKIVALQPTDFKLGEGQLTLILGPSGIGKTTLLSLLGCVIYPTFGDLYVMGQHVNKLKAARRWRWSRMIPDFKSMQTGRWRLRMDL